MEDFEEEARIVRELTRSENGTDPFSSAVRATRMPMLITDPRRPDNPIVFANASFSKLTGFDRSEIIGRNCRFLQGPETNQADISRLRDAIAKRVPIELELLNYNKNGETFWNRLLVSPVFDRDGQLSYFFASQFDVTLERERLVRLEKDRDKLESEVFRRDAEILATEQRLRFALKAGRLGSWSLDLTTNRMIASEGCKENFGRPTYAPFTYDELLAAVVPIDRERRDAAIARTIADGEPLDIEYRIVTPKNEERWVQIRGQAYYRADGAPLSMNGVSQDVTDRKRAEEHRTLLTNELSHRVKNSLAMMQAVISQTLRGARSIPEAETAIIGRIQAMSAANDLLVSERWESIDTRDLLQRTLAPFGINSTQQFRLTGPDVRLPPRIATALALGLHELATNALKYGALSIPEGAVEISWQIRNRSRPSQFFIEWTERNGPAVSIPSREGFGTKLLSRVLAEEIGGSVNIDYRESGVVFSANAPLIDADTASD